MSTEGPSELIHKLMLPYDGAHPRLSNSNIAGAPDRPHGVLSFPLRLGRLAISHVCAAGNSRANISLEFLAVRAEGRRIGGRIVHRHMP